MNHTEYIRYIFYILIGYLSGSVLYASLLPKVIKHIDVCSLSDDKNPGTANAFAHAGVPVGILVFLCELSKGTLPVFAATHRIDITEPLFALVMLAPVLGHAFPFLQTKKGGKAIAVSFGVLLGLYPELAPALILATLYIFFSAVVIIRPHLFRSIATFLLFTVCCLLSKDFPLSVKTGCFLLSAIVIFKHLETYNGERLCFTLPLLKKLFDH